MGRVICKLYIFKLFNFITVWQTPLSQLQQISLILQLYINGITNNSPALLRNIIHLLPVQFSATNLSDLCDTLWGHRLCKLLTSFFIFNVNTFRIFLLNSISPYSNPFAHHCALACYIVTYFFYCIDHFPQSAFDRLRPIILQ